MLVMWRAFPWWKDRSAAPPTLSMMVYISKTYPLERSILISYADRREIPPCISLCEFISLYFIDDTLITG